MKLNYTSILTAATLMLAAGNANANMVWDLYAGGTAGFGGMAFTFDEHHADWSAQSYGAVFGVDLPVVRFEAEYDYLTSDKIDMQLAMGNAYVKLLGAGIINPYIGVGIGMLLDTESDHYKYKDADIDPTIAYQGMLGATLNIPAIPFKIDIEGRTLYIPEIYSIAKKDVNAFQYDARVKLRYIF